MSSSTATAGKGPASATLARKRSRKASAPHEAARRRSFGGTTVRPPRPTAVELALGRLAIAPWRWVTSPRFYGLERIPRDRPVLFVGNHTLMGVLDAPLLFLMLHDECGIFLRSLGDRVHFKVPAWRSLIARFGAVEGTRENCRRLMRAGESILVFPGGGREVFKLRGERYHLIWKKRIGFARLAIEHGYTIVPLAMVGADDCFEILADRDDLQGTRLGRLMQEVSPVPDSVPPMVRGIGPTLLPRPQRFYFWFGTPIDTRRLMGCEEDDDVCFAVRERTRRAVQSGMTFLRAERRRDPDRHLAVRVVHQLGAAVGGLFGGAVGGLAAGTSPRTAGKKRGPVRTGPPSGRRRRDRQ